MRVCRYSIRFPMCLTLLLATLAVPMDAYAQGPNGGGPPGRGLGRGMGRDASMAADQAGFHFLLSNREAIQRVVTELPNGVQTRTTSEDPEVAAQIRTHVSAMYRRMKEARPLRRWDPLFAALFEKADQIAFEIEEVPGGIEVNETSTDAETVALIQTHAKVVSGFVARGFAEARMSHPAPAAARASSAARPSLVTEPAIERLLTLSDQFDRDYIPALALTNQGLQKPSLKALERLGERLIAMRQHVPDATRDDEKRLFKGATEVVAEAKLLAQRGELLKGHELLEPLREQLASRRRSMNIEYRLDVLSDYHAAMEAIVKPAQEMRPDRLDAAALDRLREQAGSAAEIWGRVERTPFDAAYAPLSDEQKQVLGAHLQTNREAITRLNRALREGNAKEALNAAVGLKPPFAKFYMSFGDFTGLTKQAAKTTPVATTGNPEARDQLPEGWSVLPTSAPLPEGGVMSKELIALGKQLYFEPRISVTGTVSCNSCHNVMEGGDDGRATSMGVFGRTGVRNAPTVWNAAFMPSQFWDGRAATLEEQAAGPMLASPEMGMPTHDLVVSRLRAIPGYVDAFTKTFGGEDPVSIQNTTKAIAAFERTLITPGSPYDRYAAGETSALTEQQVRGMQFFDQVGCASCHAPPLFGGDFHEFPAIADDRLIERHRLVDDRGREQATGDEADRCQFKTPTLRNVTLTAPYLHNGSAATLDEAVRLMGALQLGEDLSEAQVADLVAFLAGLEGPFPGIQMPRLPSRAGHSVVPAIDPKPVMAEPSGS